ARHQRRAVADPHGRAPGTRRPARGDPADAARQRRVGRARGPRGARPPRRAPPLSPGAPRGAARRAQGRVRACVRSRADAPGPSRSLASTTRPAQPGALSTTADLPPTAVVHLEHTPMTAPSTTPYPVTPPAGRVVTVGAVAWARASTGAAGAVEFTRPLAVPPLAESRVEDGVRVFELEAREGVADRGAAAPTPTLGLNGDHLGPTLRA